MNKAKAEVLLDSLIEWGFDQSYIEESDEEYFEPEEEDEMEYSVGVRCSRCEALCINGIACHETGCPNVVGETDDELEDFEDDFYLFEEEPEEEEDDDAGLYQVNEEDNSLTPVWKPTD
jgi:hypothetical protein